VTVDWGSLPFLREFAETAHTGFACLDSELRVVYLNPRAQQMFGFAAEAEDGIDLAALLIPSDHAQVQRAVELFRAGRGPEPAVWRTRMTALRREGQEVPVEVTVTLGPADSGCAFMAWVEDVSEEARLLSELANALRGGSPNLAEILDSLAEAVTIRDPHHHIIYANRAALRHMGFASLEELQRHGAQAIMDDYLVLDEHGQPVTMADIPSVRLLEGKEAEPLLIRTVHRETGEGKWDLLKSTLLRDDRGRPAATVTIIEDVTTEKTVQLRERFLSRATDTLMSSLDYEETLSNVAWLAVPEIADWCAVDLVDAPGQTRRLAVAHTDPDKLALATELRQHSANQEGGTERVARTGVAELYSEITEEMLVEGAQNERHLELLREVGLRSVIVVPMRIGARTVGVMTLVTAESLRRFDEGDLAFTEQLAARAAIAVDNARLATERRAIAETLQRSLLPDADPSIEGWEVATLYRPARASDEVEVGGDFYDFIDTPAGWLVLLGDVTGRGVEAAAMTSLVRHGARFTAKEVHSPAAILARLDEALREQAGLSLCSALCVRLEPDRVVMSSAGHPPPLIVRHDGRIREIGSPGPLLGGWAGSTWIDVALPITPRETLLMYTDGVTDTPGEAGRFGPERLRRVLVDHAPDPPDRLLAALAEELDGFQVAGQADDTGAVALRPEAVGAEVQGGVTLASGDRPASRVS
jgi:PAS domain S-box-containing protein